MQLNEEVDSPALQQSIEQYNVGDFDAAVASLEKVNEPSAQLAKAIVGLWLAGSLETEVEWTMVPQALVTLRAAVKRDPGNPRLADLLSDAEIFQKAMGFTSIVEAIVKAITS